MCGEIAGLSNMVPVAWGWKSYFVCNQKGFYFRKLLGDELNLGLR